MVRTVLFHIHKMIISITYFIAGTRGNCFDIGKQVSELGYRVSVKDYIEAVEKTGNELIRETVEKYTHNKCQVISTIGKNENLQDYQLLRNMMYKWF